MNQIFGVFAAGGLAATHAVRPSASQGSGGVNLSPPTDTAEFLADSTPQSEGQPSISQRLSPETLAVLSQDAGFGFMPPEGKISSLMATTPGPEPLSPERAGELKHELLVLGELGYLQQGDPDFPRPASHDQAFTLMEKGKPVFWRQYPNSDAIQFTSWDHMAQTARDAREHTKR